LGGEGITNFEEFEDMLKDNLEGQQTVNDVKEDYLTPT